MDKKAALDRMKRYFSEPRMIDHTCKVLEAAEAILAGDEIQGEFLQAVVILSCVFHDIGIPEAKRIHGSSDGPFQEKEGAVIARELLTELGERPDVLERACYIVGKHHTFESIDGLDFQIVWEADMLVNLGEGYVKPDVPRDEFISKNFQTQTGQSLATEQLPS